MKLFSVRFRRTSLILVGCTTFLLGIGLARYDHLNVSIIWIILLACYTGIAWRRKNILTLLFVVATCLLFGLWRGNQFAIETQAYQHLYEHNVTIIGEVKSDSIYGKNGQLSFELGKVELVKPYRDSMVGVVNVSGYGENAIYRGDIVSVQGKLKSTLGSKQGRISYAEVNLLNSNPSLVQKLRSKFTAGIYSAIPDPEASFGLGVLIGQRDTLPKETSDILKIVGLTHIIAVSGYNLTILVRAAQRAFGKRSKYQATLAAFLLITSFLAVTGLSASIVRAAIVSTLGLLAWYFGRLIRPTLLIALSAAITAGWYPIYPWSDIGWYLSFLAFFGVLVLAPLVTQRIWGPDKKHSTMNLVIIESFCAQIMTIPIILFIFHQSSLVGLVANILVVPLVPLAMVLGLFAGIAGVFVPILAGYVAWPATILLTYMLDVARVLSRVPNAQVKLNVDLFTMLFLYATLLFICWVLYLKVKGKYGTIKQNYFDEMTG